MIPGLLAQYLPHLPQLQPMPLAPIQAPAPGLQPIAPQPMAQQAVAPLSPNPSGMQRLMGAAMPEPQAMAGMFGEGDLASARKQGLLSFGLALLGDSGRYRQGEAPTFGQSLAKGAGAMQQGFNGALEQQMAQQQAMAAAAQKQRQQAALAQVMSQYGDPSKLSDAQMSRMLKDLAGVAASTGNTELLGRLGAFAGLMENKGEKPTLTYHDLGDRVGIFDAQGRLLRTEAKGKTPETPEQAAARQQGALKAKNDQVNKIVDDYARDTKDFREVMSGYEVLQGAIKNPSLATPFAVLDAYARVTNPGAVVRPTTMEMLHNMGSLGQRIEKFMQHNATGTLPPDILRDLNRTIFGIVKQHEKQYHEVLRATLTRGKDAGVDITPYLQQFHVEDAMAPGAGLPGAAGRNPLLEP